MGEGDSGVRRRINAGVKGAFVAALRRGARIEDAAREAGCSPGGLYGARRRDPLFRAAWTDALASSAAPHLIAANNKRGWQLRKMRHVRFDADRKERFLAYFTGTCDVTAAAEAAGVCESTVYKNGQRDPDFAAAWEEALAAGYARLEAEAVRQRLAMQKRLRDGLVPEGEVAAEFERVLKLLTRYERRGGRIGFQSPGEGRMKRWSFDEAIEALDKKLRALGARRSGA